MRESLRWQAALALAVLCLGLSGCTEPQTVKDIIGNSDKYLNKSVTVWGVTSNSEGVPRVPGEPTRSKFDLTDKSGTIHVVSTGDAPPNNVEMTVTGTLDNEPLPLTLHHAGGVLTPTNILYGALTALGAVAIALVVLLTRKPRQLRVPRAATLSEPLQATGSGGPERSVQVGAAPDGTGGRAGSTGPAIVRSGQVCPSCGIRNDADARFCEECSHELRDGPAPRPAPVAVTAVSTATIPPPQTAIADLTIVETAGDQLNARFELTTDPKGMRIGRDARMDILVDDETVSKEHARLWWADGDGAFCIQDENSSWGTRVNGTKVARAKLVDGDKIFLGRTTLVFRLLRAPTAADRTVPPPGIEATTAG